MTEWLASDLDSFPEQYKNYAGKIGYVLGED
jgi:hypothetical protein